MSVFWQAPTGCPLTKLTWPGYSTERSTYPEIWGLSHSACAGFSDFQAFK